MSALLGGHAALRADDDAVTGAVHSVVWHLVGGTLDVRVEVEGASARLFITGSSATNAPISMRVEGLAWTLRSGESWSEWRLTGCTIGGIAVQFDLVSITSAGRENTVLFTNLPAALGLMGATYLQPALS